MVFIFKLIAHRYLITMNEFKHDHVGGSFWLTMQEDLLEQTVLMSIE